MFKSKYAVNNYWKSRKSIIVKPISCGSEGKCTHLKNSGRCLINCGDYRFSRGGALGIKQFGGNITLNELFTALPAVKSFSESFLVMLRGLKRWTWNAISHVKYILRKYFAFHVKNRIEASDFLQTSRNTELISCVSTFPRHERNSTKLHSQLNCFHAWQVGRWEINFRLPRVLKFCNLRL